MIYSMFCTLDCKPIGTSHGDYADDAAAIEKARWYLRTSTADTIRVHREAPFYPLGELVAELRIDSSAATPRNGTAAPAPAAASGPVIAREAESAPVRARAVVCSPGRCAALGIADSRQRFKTTLVF
jgi:hypothetical protein